MIIRGSSENAINAVFGNQELNRIFLGNKLIWERTVPPTPVPVFDQGRIAAVLLDENERMTDDISYFTTIEATNQFLAQNSFNNYYVHIGDDAGIEDLGESAFEERDNLIGIYIPPSVVWIEILAFNKCYNLKNVSLPETMEEIGGGAFKECTNLTSIYLPNAISYIGDESFMDSGLTSLTLPTSLADIGEYAFSGTHIVSVSVPDGTEAVEEGAFSNCQQLITANLPIIVNFLGSKIFENCTSLKNVNIPRSFGSDQLNGAIFRNCSSLEEIIIPSNVKYLGGSDFEGCSSLRDITIEYGLEVMYRNTFKNCTSLVSIDIPGSIKQINNNTQFEGCYNLQFIYVHKYETDLGAVPPWGAPRAEVVWLGNS